MKSTQAQAPPCSHRGEEVQVGPFKICVGGTQYFSADDLVGYDLIVPLTGNTPWKFGTIYNVLALPLVDFGGVPSNWRDGLEAVIRELSKKKRVLAFCIGSHGRTGCFLGSLIALLETQNVTPDPIEAVRERHCQKAVETRSQAEAIFALRGKKLPRYYMEEFPVVISVHHSQKGEIK